MLFSSLAACLMFSSNFLPVNKNQKWDPKKPNINLYGPQCVKIRLNDILDFRYNPNLKEKK